jgi:predicted enzyme related to lactoylglutathione lyase
MPDKTARGRFVWHELMVPDAAKAHEFYGRVVGWKTQPFEHDPNYQMFAASTGPLGGTVVQTEGPPHWLPFLGTTDIEGTVKQATGLGATLVTEIASIPNGGRWARLTDPQGASFAVYQSTTKPGREKPPKRGEFSWHELMTTDHQAAFEFYSAVFGWEKTGEMDMGGELGVYFMFGRNGVPLGGMFNMLKEAGGGPAWTGYIRVKDVNKALKKAKAGGATLINGPMEVPGGDWIAQLIDPQGAMFAVHALQADVAPSTTEPATPAPAQGTLDFPPAASGALEKVAVAAKEPVTKAAKAKSAATKAPRKKAQRKKVSAKPAAKKAALKQRPVKKKAAASKKKATKKRPAAPQRAKKAVRKAPRKKTKKQARRGK